MRDPNELSLPELFEAVVAGPALDRLLMAALTEDLGDAGDVTSDSLFVDDLASARLVARADGVIAGGRAVNHLLRRAGVDHQVECRLKIDDGAFCAHGDVVGTLRGSLLTILRLERTLLNLLGHLGGVATLTRRFVDAVAGTRAAICDTRKTLPGLRTLEKYAVRCGGGTIHRLGLSDAALYKDNHLARLPVANFGRQLAAAIRAAHERSPLRFVEVEVDTLAQLELILDLEPGLVDIVLLDNMDAATLRQAVARRDAHASSILLEASGGVTLESVGDIAATGVDRIAVGALTHSAPALDLGLDLDA